MAEPIKPLPAMPGDGALGLQIYNQHLLAPPCRKAAFRSSSWEAFFEMFAYQPKQESLTQSELLSVGMDFGTNWR